MNVQLGSPTKAQPFGDATKVSTAAARTASLTSAASSTMTGPPTSLAARMHFCAEISSGSPCSSGRSIFCETICTGKSPPVLRMALTSSSFLAFPVTKHTFGRPAVAAMLAVASRMAGQRSLAAAVGSSTVVARATEDEFGGWVGENERHVESHGGDNAICVEVGAPPARQ